MLPRIGPITMTAPPKMHQVCMAPSRSEGSGASVGSPAKAPLPLSRRLIREIQRHVASSGRSLQRLEICGRIIDNFDDLDDLVDDSTPDQEREGSPVGNAIEFVTTAEEDDDLTNLTWLQDRNLLRGINLSKSDAEDSRPSPVPVMSQSTDTQSLPSSPTSECGSEHTESPPTAVSTPTPAPAPYDTQTHAFAKPPYSFSCLIFMAIEASSARALPVKEIYAWIVRHFPYFKEAPQGWKNSVRHNLSLNKCFHKVDKRPSLGKGSLWTVDPRHRGSLLQAFGRSPIPPSVSRAPICAPETPTPTPPRKGAPDPQLFPFLAKRLAGGSGDENGETNQTATCMDDYLAAATVLAMKYGPSVMMKLPPAPDSSNSGVVISSSPSEDHTYLGGGLAGVRRDERRTAEALLNLAGVTSEDIQLQHYQSQQQHHNLHSSSVALSPPHSFDSAEDLTPHRPRLLRRPAKRRGASELGAPKRRPPALMQATGALDRQAPAYRFYASAKPARQRRGKRPQRRKRPRRGSVRNAKPNRAHLRVHGANSELHLASELEGIRR